MVDVPNAFSSPPCQAIICSCHPHCLLNLMHKFKELNAQSFHAHYFLSWRGLIKYGYFGGPIKTCLALIGAFGKTNICNNIQSLIDRRGTLIIKRLVFHVVVVFSVEVIIEATATKKNCVWTVQHNCKSLFSCLFCSS